MAEAKLRVKLKHDTEANWLKATTFKPFEGELIIYDVDSAHSAPRFKVGDGVKVVGDLPFTDKDLAKLGDINADFLSDLLVAGSGISINKKTDAEKVEVKINPLETIRVAAVRMDVSSDEYTVINPGQIVHVYGPNVDMIQFPTNAGKLVTDASFKTINGNSIVGSGDITISGGGDVTLAGNNTFTGTNKFTSNTLEVNDGKSLSDDGKAAIFSASSMKLYDGTAGRNYTINFPAYSSVLSGNATLVTNVDISNWGYIKSSDNITFTGSNIFKKSVDFTYGIISISNVSSSSSPNTDGIYFTDTSNNTLCWYQGNKWTTDTGKVIKLPTSAGTLALTSDIKIKSASLDGTTLTLTI